MQFQNGLLRKSRESTQLPRVHPEIAARTAFGTAVLVNTKESIVDYFTEAQGYSTNFWCTIHARHTHLPRDSHLAVYIDQRYRTFHHICELYSVI